MRVTTLSNAQTVTSICRQLEVDAGALFHDGHSLQLLPKKGNAKKSTYKLEDEDDAPHSIDLMEVLSAASTWLKDGSRWPAQLCAGVEVEDSTGSVIKVNLYHQLETAAPRQKGEKVDAPLAKVLNPLINTTLFRVPCHPDTETIEELCEDFVRSGSAAGLDTMPFRSKAPAGGEPAPQWQRDYAGAQKLALLEITKTKSFRRSVGGSARTTAEINAGIQRYVNHVTSKVKRGNPPSDWSSSTLKWFGAHAVPVLRAAMADGYVPPDDVQAALDKPARPARRAQPVANAAVDIDSEQELEYIPSHQVNVEDVEDEEEEAADDDADGSSPAAIRDYAAAAQARSSQPSARRGAAPTRSQDHGGRAPAAAARQLQKGRGRVATGRSATAACENTPPRALRNQLTKDLGAADPEDPQDDDADGSSPPAIRDYAAAAQARSSQPSARRGAAQVNAPAQTAAPATRKRKELAEPASTSAMQVQAKRRHGSR